MNHEIDYQFFDQLNVYLAEKEQQIQELLVELDAANARAAQAEAERDAVRGEYNKMVSTAVHFENALHEACEELESFRAKFDEWILRQTEDVKFSAAMALGSEYLDGAK